MKKQQHIFFKKIRQALLPGLLLCCFCLSSQTPFNRTGSVFFLLPSTNELVEFYVHPSFNSLNFNTLGTLPGGNPEALGFRKTDNLLYAIGQGNNHLYRIDATATAEDLGPIGLDNTLFYLAGDVSPDGKWMVSVGSDNLGNDVHIASTDLTDPAHPTTFTPFLNGTFLTDIAFDPFTSEIFGYDKTGKRIVKISVSGNLTPFAPIEAQNDFKGIYFDAFGDLYAYGSTVFGVVDGLFLVNKNTGQETRLATGPNTPVADMASCPFSVELKNGVQPLSVLPCSEVSFTYALANGSGETLTGVDFSHPLPMGFYLSQVVQNPFGVPVDTMSVPGSILMKNLTIAPGTKNFSFKISVGDVPKGNHKSHASLQKLPSLYGTESFSDNPDNPGFGDSSSLEVNRFDEDSLFNAWLICLGQTLELDGSEYGNTVKWNNGSSSPTIDVTVGGMYSLQAGTSCENIVVVHEVTSTECPFVISVAHFFEPDTIFPCSEVTMRFILKNSSGEPRGNVSFTDTLPAGFSFVEITKNPFGGVLDNDALPNVIRLDGLSLKTGVDTLDILVEVGEIAMGKHLNRAKIFNLPPLMGPIRFSDFPPTQPADSTPVVVIGTAFDTLIIDTFVCFGSEMVLDASLLGKTFLWDNGSTAPQLPVNQPGSYHAIVFGGCDPADVFWNIVEGEAIQISELGPFEIHQGEQVEMAPILVNQGDSLSIIWQDSLGNSLSCLDCPNPLAMPLHSVFYPLKVSNEFCSDSTMVEFIVDESRRIYAPNVFSPNSDGINDFFFLQSPDFGEVKQLVVVDRWGTGVFRSENSKLNVSSSGWDGKRNDREVQPGTFLWWAEVEFVDGRREVLKGGVTVVR